MLPSDKFFVPREEILKLTLGSFEHRAIRIEDTLKKEKAKFFEGSEVQVLGTFDEHAIVLSESGKVFRVIFESSATGDVMVMSAEAMPNVAFPRESLPAYLRREARVAADLYLKGLIPQATEKIAQISKMVEANAVYSDDQIVDVFLGAVTSHRSWKQVLGLKTEAELKTTLGESFGQIDSAKLQPKFSKLYDGSLSKEDLEQYRVLVHESFGKLNTKMKAVHEQVLKSVAQIREVSEKLSEKQRETVEAFSSFADDLLSDLRETQHGLAETLQGADGVGALGRLFDSLTEDLLRYEVAGGFVVRMTTQLAQASR